MALPLLSGGLGIAGLAGGEAACVSALPAALALWQLLARVDPAGTTLSFDPLRGWALHSGGAARPCAVHGRGRFVSSLLLAVDLDGSPRRRYLLFFGDALDGGQWRRLRRAIRLQQHD